MRDSEAARRVDKKVSPSRFVDFLSELMGNGRLSVGYR